METDGLPRIPQFAALTSEQEWREAFPILQQLRTSLALESFIARREALQARGFRLVGLRLDGKLVCAASYIIYPHITHGVDCWIHDLVTDRASRSKGFGRQLVEEIESRARAEGCSRVVVHTRNDNAGSRRFYSARAGFEQYAVVFRKQLPDK